MIQPIDALKSDYPFPWTYDYEHDESIEDETERAYLAEPVIRDAKGELVLDTGHLDGFGAFGRYCFAEWLVAQTKVEVGFCTCDTSLSHNARMMEDGKHIVCGKPVKPPEATS